MRFRPTSLKPHPVDRTEPHRIILAPGDKMKRGIAARKGPVAWSQPSNGSFWSFARYNTERPFFAMPMPVKWWRYSSTDPDSSERGTVLLEWMTDMESKKDWRLVQREMIDQLEGVAKDFYEYGKWHASNGNEGKQPYGTKKPYHQASQGYFRTSADVTRCVTICRLRMDETETAAYRAQARTRALSEAIDTAESARRMAEWEKKGNGKSPA